MSDSKECRRARVRRWGVLLALGSLGALLFALSPGAASAGIEPGSNALTVNIAGGGSGTVTQISGPATPPINCVKTGNAITGNCNATTPFGAPPEPYVGLQAAPSAQSEFAGWQITASDGPPVFFNCGQQVTCFVQMNSDVTVTATFNNVPGFPVTVVRQGPAANSGSVTSSPPGINCAPSAPQIDCTASYNQGTVVTLTAAPGPGATFGGWGGACASSGQNLVCILSVNTVLAVTATFNIQTFGVTVSVTGDGGVSSNIQPGISCQTGNQGTCSANFASNQQISFTASPDTGYAFSGWGGACSGTANPCVVTLNQAANITATFTATAVQATVTGNKVIYSSRNPKRVLQIKVSAQQVVNVRIQLQKGGVNYASRRISGVDEGQSVLTLRIKNSTASGKYTAVVTFTNQQGAPPLVVNRNVKLKPVPG